MDIAFYLDFVSTLLLLGAVGFLWREKKHFYSLTPVLPAFFFLAIGRFCDMVLEHPDIHIYEMVGLSPRSSEVAFGITGNLTDVTGICLLILGFVRIIKYQSAEEKRLRILENLLPICANCKKFRNDEGRWMPIEKFLIDTAAQRVTHTMCPDCIAAYYPEFAAKMEEKGREKKTSV